MIPTAKWIDRQFAFDLPVWMFPNLVERLRGTPARVEDRVLTLPVATLIQRAGEGWSIQEHVGHLLSVEMIWIGRLDDFDAGLESLRPADMLNQLIAAADYNEWTLEVILQRFRAARIDLIQRLESMDETAVLRTARHPRLNKPMRVLDLLHFAAEHDDHHLVRISEALSRA